MKKNMKLRLIKSVIVPIVLQVLFLLFNHLLVSSEVLTLVTNGLIGGLFVLTLLSSYNIYISYSYGVSYNTELFSRIGHFLYLCLTVIFIESRFDPIYSSMNFYIKYIIIFLLMVTIILYFFYLSNRYLRSQVFMGDMFKRQSNYMFVVLIVVSVLFLSFGEVAYVKGLKPEGLKTSPSELEERLFGCSYYDHYNNLLYQSQIIGQCPSLEQVVMEDTDHGSRLSFSVTEEENDRLDFHQSIIEYRYDSEHRVAYYSFVPKDYKHERERLVKKEIVNTYKNDNYVKAVFSETYDSIDTDEYTKLTTYESVLKASGDIEVNKCESTTCTDGKEQLYEINLDRYDRKYYRSIRDVRTDDMTMEIWMGYFRKRIRNDDDEHFYINRSYGIHQELFNLDDYFLNSIEHYNGSETNMVVHKTDINNHFKIYSDDNQYELHTKRIDTDYGYILKHYKRNIDSEEFMLEYGELNGMHGDLGKINNYYEQFKDRNLWDQGTVDFVYLPNPLLFDYFVQDRLEEKEGISSNR